MIVPTPARPDAIAAVADEVVQRAARADPAVPGVVAGVTDRESTLYLGAAGSRDLGTRER